MILSLFISFPGGKKDPEDKNLVETAVREMEEELGLEGSHVHIWAPMPAIPDRVSSLLNSSYIIPSICYSEMDFLLSWFCSLGKLLSHLSLDLLENLM